MIGMAEISCPRCRELEARIAELEQRLHQMEAKLGLNATNSSIPPSANPPGAPKPARKKKSRRSAGAQPGHPPHLKQLLPAERVSLFVPLVPTQCQDCQAMLPDQPADDDPEPTRFQVAELPPILAEVTEYQGYAISCACCGKINWAVIPPEVRAHSVGPRLTATLSYLTGCHGVSKRDAEEIADRVFGAPISLGTVANLEQEVSAALATPHQEALDAVRTADVKQADETSWKRAGQLHWLWAAGAASQKVVAYVIHPKRSRLGLQALLGEAITGILASDRWGVYNCVAATQRQLCWAHLKRDFQKIVDGGGPSRHVGRQGLKTVKKVFAAWHAFQDGKLTRRQLQATLEPVAYDLGRALERGTFGSDTKVAEFCTNVLKLEAALWTFLTVEGVEPTNNFMERMLRRAVLWRKRSFGCWSDAGCRFVERILTVVQTRRLQGQNVLEYLHEAVLALRTGQPCPKLLPSG
jgi:transposase